MGLGARLLYIHIKKLILSKCQPQQNIRFYIFCISAAIRKPFSSIFICEANKNRDSAKDVRALARESRCSASAPTCDTFMPLAA